VVRQAKVLSRFHHPASQLAGLRRIYVSAAVTGFVILNLLVSYYSPQVRILVTGSVRQTFQIYLFDNGYTETNSQYYTAHTVRDPGAPDALELTFPIHERFRLDFLGDGTVAFPGRLTVVTRTGLRQVAATYRFDPALLTTHGLRRNPQGAFTFVAADDPYIDVLLRALPLESVSTAYSICPVLYVLGPILFALFLYRIRRDLAAHRSLVLGMFCVCMFLSFLALTLPYNHGPDEETHIFSGQWYLTHLWPPSIASPVFYDAYWGWNYVVGSPDLTYLLTFKLAHGIEMLHPVDLYRAARIAQIAVLFGAFLLVLRFTRVHVAWAFLLSAVLVPQIAYTVTYVNGDALSYFLSIAALGILLAPKDLDSRIAIPVSLFVLCNTKTNYLVLLPVALYILYRQYGFKYWPYVAGGLAIASYRRVFTLLDEHLVGRSFLQNELLHCSASVRDRLLSGRLEYATIISPEFYETSLKSLYAKFGYMTFSLPWYFYVVGASLAILLILANDRRERILIAVVFVMNLGISEYFSMSLAYQPQGRYLFPTIVVLVLMSARRIPVLKYQWCAIPTALAVTAFWLRYLGGAS